jgi:hypothetical protein
MWVADDVVVASPSPDKAWVKARMAGQGGLDGNAAFMDLANKVDSGATLGFAALPAAGSDLDLSKQAQGAKGFYGSLKITDGLGIDAGMRFDTPENAKAALTQATGLIQQFKGGMPPALQGIAEKLKLANAANDVTMQLQLSAADLQALQGAIGPMMGGMMGGMAK